MRTPKERQYDLLGPRVVEALVRRGNEAVYVTDAAAAREQIHAWLLRDQVRSVGWGGTETMTECGVFDLVREMDLEVIDRDTAESFEKRQDMMRRALAADAFLMSFNALSADGIAINIDGIGNRLSAMIWGPKYVYAIVGMNKVAPDYDSAVLRARQVASPMNAIRLECDTPCATTGRCADCMGDNSICSYFVANRRVRPRGRIKVILVGADLGF
ncbi:MAG: lactate utilization protein [Actinomycetes bacterium]|jgi:L-lactate utilization protein LutB|nr:lactate utilization protein [Actinomycetes bacterium]